ncbi:MAG: hypothetical protein V2A34_10620 [Lentisphaerota bacterium]
MGRGIQTDFSSFMCIILMLIGVLMLIMIINVLTIIANPENIKITSIITSSIYTKERGEEEGMSPFPFGNKQKNPAYVDVYRDHMVIYPGDEVVTLRDLELEGNAFERLLIDVDSRKTEEYIVLLARPRSANIVRRLRKVIRDRDIDVGVELFETDREVSYEKAMRASGRWTNDAVNATQQAEKEPEKGPVQ